MTKFDAPFICKIRFYDPSGKNPAKNAAHINYIGTRPGADIGDIEIKGEDELSPDSAAGHVKYVHERPGSHGLFSDDKSTDIKMIQNELKEHKGVVWRIVLSLKETDAARLDLTSRERWEETLRASVPEAAEKMGIGHSNLRWVAAFHQEQGHPHVHLVIWEKNPIRTKGLLSKGERRDVKKVFMRQVYAGERTRLLQERTAMRDLIRDIAKGDTEKAVSLVDEVRNELGNLKLELQAAGSVQSKIAPKMYLEDVKDYAKQLDKLSKMLPGKGRVALQFMPQNVKEEARTIAERLMNQPAFKGTLDRYLQSVEGITSLHTQNNDVIKKSQVKAYNDLRDRVANIIVRGAAQINKLDRQRYFQQRGQALKNASVAKGVWKSVWNAMEQLRIQSEAQGELQRRRSLQVQKRRQYQQEK